MDFLKPRTLKARQKALALLLPCLSPVQDDLGNVPVAMQKDLHVNGALIGLSECVCRHFGVQPSCIPQVIAIVFEEIYRREATEVLTLCDPLMENPDSALCRARSDIAERATGTPDPSWVTDLERHIQSHYKRPGTLVL